MIIQSKPIKASLGQQWPVASMLLLLILLFTSCQDEMLTKTTIDAPVATIAGYDITFSEGIARIPNIQAITDLSNLSVSDDQSLSALEGAQAYFESSHEAFNALMINETSTLETIASNPHIAVVLEQEGEQYLEPTVDNEVFKHLANQDGVLEVGDAIWKFNRNELLKLSKSDFDIYGLNNLEEAPSLKRQVIKRNIQIVTKRNIDRCRSNFSRGNRDYQLTGEIENTDPVIGRKHVYARSKFYRKRFGIWWGIHADRLCVGYDLAIRTGPNAPSFSIREPLTCKNAQNFALEVASFDRSESVTVEPGGYSEHEAEERSRSGDCRCAS